MRLFNHKDAAVAAEFVGRDHKFVLNQVSAQSGTSYTDTGGDNFGVNSGAQQTTKIKLNGSNGRNTSLSDSDGHSWGSTRGWSVAENVGRSHTDARVYEFVVEPRALMGMPDTAFLLVDSTGPSRRVDLADADPEICLRDRVSLTPRAEPS
jgi:hypothetical protein